MCANGGIVSRGLYRVEVRPQPPDRVLGDVRRQLTASGSERKDADLLVRVLDPLRDVRVEDADAAALNALPGGQERLGEDHLWVGRVETTIWHSRTKPWVIHRTDCSALQDSIP